MWNTHLTFFNTSLSCITLLPHSNILSFLASLWPFFRFCGLFKIKRIVLRYKLRTVIAGSNKSRPPKSADCRSAAILAFSHSQCSFELERDRRKQLRFGFKIRPVNKSRALLKRAQFVYSLFGHPICFLRRKVIASFRQTTMRF